MIIRYIFFANKVKIQDITKQTRFLIWGAGGDPKEAK